MSTTIRESQLKPTPRTLLMPALTLVLGACASAPKAPAIPPYDLYMAQADALVRSQDVAGAKAKFRKATEADTDAKAPWVRLAELDFNAQDYGPAITEAQEVLKRDAMDTTAHSILTVAGLRVALDALGMIHRESDPKGPAHMEAAKVAQKLRETLGQDLLSPPKKKRRTTKPVITMPLDESARPSVPDVSPDPFNKLRLGS